MSNASNNQGRAYEFVCLNSLYEAINKIRPAKIVRNSSYLAAENAWDTLTQGEQTLYALSAVLSSTCLPPREPSEISITLLSNPLSHWVAVPGVKTPSAQMWRPVIFSTSNPLQNGEKTCFGSGFLRKSISNMAASALLWAISKDASAHS